MAREIRFAAGTKDDLRSSVWILWARKDELYLAGRSLAGLTKISFHKSGICRIAATSTGPRPAMARWNRAKETAPGITTLISVIVPSFNLGGRYRDALPPENKSLLLIPPPDEGTKLVVRVMLTDKSITEKDIYSLPRDRIAHVVGPIALVTASAWLYYYYDELRMAEFSEMSGHIEKLKFHVSTEKAKTDVISAHLHAFRTNVEPQFVIDLPLNPNNVMVDGE